VRVSYWRLIILWVVVPLTSSFADQRTANWTGPYTACNQHGELLRRDGMDLGVKFSTSSPELEQQFRQALSFWAEVLDMSWHEDDTSSCSIQLVDGTPEILKRTIVARSQFTDWEDFQGWIAFSPTAKLSQNELYLTAVHEIGHMLGLKHNPDARSVMYFLDLEGQEYLDTTDLALLASRHKLRFGLRKRIPVVKTEQLASN
jgi:matrixin